MHQIACGPQSVSVQPIYVGNYNTVKLRGGLINLLIKNRLSNKNT